MARMQLLLLAMVTLGLTHAAMAAPGLGMYPDQTQAPPGIDIEYEPARVNGSVNTVGNYNFLKKPVVSLPAVENDIPLLYNAQNDTNYAEQVSVAPACSNATYFYITWTLPRAKGSPHVKYWAGKKRPKHPTKSAACPPSRYTVFAGTPGAYTSGYIYHCLIGPLDYGTLYTYKLPKQKPGMVYNFTTFPAPGMPVKLAMIADVGQTWNSSSTFDNVKASGAALTLFAGDLNYADNYGPREDCVPFTGTDDGNSTYCGLGGLRWDSAMRLSEKVFSYIPVAYVPGNHELEAPAAWFPLGVQPVPYVAYKARVPGFLPDPTYPANVSPPYAPFYYSYNVGLVHVINLATYYAFTRYTAQWVWIQQDIATINRTITPFVIVMMHNPIYHNNKVHYYEGEGFRAEYETFFYKAKVDLVVAGHIHAYERSLPVYKYQLDQCGPTHIVVGNGGNIEGVAGPHMVTPIDELKPVYTAITDYYYGHAELNVINATYAEYTWMRNIDGGKVGDSFALIPKATIPGC